MNFKIILILKLLSFAACIEIEPKNKTISCPYPFVNSYNGYTFSYCYHYLGISQTFNKAFQSCMTSVYSGIVSPRLSDGLDDLYKLYKAFPNYYFWVGAIATPANPTTFRWQDGSPVYPATWCAGHPKGGDNLCTFYTTKAIVGRDKCIESGPCTASFFDHGIICQYGA